MFNNSIHLLPLLCAYVHTYVGLISYAQAPTICNWCTDVVLYGQQVEVVLPEDVVLYYCRCIILYCTIVLLVIVLVWCVCLNYRGHQFSVC